MMKFMKPIRWFVLILFIISLLACQVSRLTEKLSAPGAILLSDNFSDPASGWPHVSAVGGAMDYFGDAYRILVVSINYDLWAVSGREYTDVRLEVDAGPLSGPVDNRFGLVCRYLNGQNFYFFVISADGYYAIGKVRDGVRSLLGQEMMANNAAITTGIAFNHLRFDCTADTLAGYVNDLPVAITQDADFSAGDVGLLAGAFDTPGVDIAFDNFVAIKP